MAEELNDWQDIQDWEPVASQVNDAVPSQVSSAKTQAPNDWQDITDWKEVGDKPEPEGAFATGLREAAHSAIPTAGGIATGAALGTMLGGPVGGVVGTVGGFVAGAMGGGYLLQKAQDYLLDKLGLSDNAQREANVEANPKSAFVGELAPSALFFSPGKLAGSLASRTVGAGLGGGLEAGTELAQKGELDPTKIAISAATFGVLNNPTRAGKGLLSAGEEAVARFRPGRPDLAPKPEGEGAKADVEPAVPPNVARGVSESKPKPPEDVTTTGNPESAPIRDSGNKGVYAKEQPTPTKMNPLVNGMSEDTMAALRSSVDKNSFGPPGPEAQAPRDPGPPYETGLGEVGDKLAALSPKKRTAPPRTPETPASPSEQTVDTSVVGVPEKVGPMEEPLPKDVPVTTGLEQAAENHPHIPNVRVVRANGVKWLAGSSNDMRTVYIDPSVPRTIDVNGKTIDPSHSLAVHELYERSAIAHIIEEVKAGRLKLKETTPDGQRNEIYELAHEHAGNAAERAYLQEHFGFSEADWKRYQEIMREHAAKTEREPGVGANAPEDLFTWMYPGADQEAAHPGSRGEAFTNARLPHPEEEPPVLIPDKGDVRLPPAPEDATLELSRTQREIEQSASERIRSEQKGEAFKAEPPPATQKAIEASKQKTLKDLQAEQGSADSVVQRYTPKPEGDLDAQMEALAQPKAPKAPAEAKPPKVIGHAIEQLRNAGMHDAAALIRDTLSAKGPEEAAQLARRSLEMLDSRTGKIQEGEYANARIPSKAATVDDLKNPDGSPVTARTKAEAEVKTKSIEAVKQAFKDHPPGENDVLPTSVEQKAQFRNRLSAAMNKATELNGGKDPLAYKPQVPPAEWMWLNEVNKLLKRVRMTPKNIAEFVANEKLLRGTEEDVNTYRRGNRIDADIAKNKRVFDTGAETEAGAVETPITSREDLAGLEGRMRELSPAPEDRGPLFPAQSEVNKRGPLAREVAKQHLPAYDLGYEGKPLPEGANNAEQAAWDRGANDRMNADRQKAGSAFTDSGHTNEVKKAQGWLGEVREAARAVEEGDLGDLSKEMEALASKADKPLDLTEMKPEQLEKLKTDMDKVTQNLVKEADKRGTEMPQWMREAEERAEKTGKLKRAREAAAAMSRETKPPVTTKPGSKASEGRKVPLTEEAVKAALASAEKAKARSNRTNPQYDVLEMPKEPPKKGAAKDVVDQINRNNKRTLGEFWSDKSGSVPLDKLMSGLMKSAENKLRNQYEREHGRQDESFWRSPKWINWMKEHASDKAYNNLKPLFAKFAGDESGALNLPKLDTWFKTRKAPVKNFIEKMVGVPMTDLARKADALAFAKGASAKHMEQNIVVKAMKADWMAFTKRTNPEERLAFLNALESVAPGQRGDFQMHLKMAGVRDEHVDWMADRAPIYRHMLDEAFRMEETYGSRAEYIENYVPHLFKDIAKVRDYLKNRRVQLGPTWFQKHREFELLQDALKNGFELRYDNPADLITHRLISSIDMKYKVETLRKLNDLGAAFPTKKDANYQPPDYTNIWHKVVAPNGAEWRIAPDVHNLWNNAVEAKGLWANEGMPGDVFRGWMKLKNVWVPVKLAMSAFHFLHMANVVLSENIARGLGAPTFAGKIDGVLKAIPESARDALFALPLEKLPLVGKNFKRVAAYEGKGMRVITETPDHLLGPDELTLKHLYQEAGVSPHMSEQLRIAAEKDFTKALAESNYVKTLPAGLRRGVEKMQSWLFEEYVPNLKAAMMLRNVEALLRNDPSLANNHVARGVALRAIGKSVDDRFGEMFYGSLFWNRTLKDASIGSFLSLGWNLGQFRQFMGAAHNLATKAGGRGSPMQQLIYNKTNKGAYAVSYLATTMAAAGALSYAMSGSPPTGMDYFFPRAGGTNPDGSPARLTTMFNTREIPMVVSHVQEQNSVLGGIQTLLWNKMVLQPIVNAFTNRDYFGNELYDPNAPWYKKMVQLVDSELGDAFNPIVLSGKQRAKEQGGSWARQNVLPFLGFGPAPTYISRSAIQNRIAHEFNKGPAAGPRPYEESGSGLVQGAYRWATDNPRLATARHEARGELNRAIQAGDADAAAAARAKLIKTGMSPTTVAKLRPGESDVYMFSRLNLPVQKALVRDMSKDEFQKYVIRNKGVVGRSRIELLKELPSR